MVGLPGSRATVGSPELLAIVELQHRIPTESSSNNGSTGMNLNFW